MNTSHLLRRLHLYLGLALLPWFLMYGISSLPFAHNRYFENRDAAKGLPLWTMRLERSYEAPVPAGQEELREFGRGILREVGLKPVNFGVYRQSPTRLIVNTYSFLKSTRVIYASDRKWLTVEDRRFRFDQFLTGMHARGGFEQDGFLSDSWGVMVDIVCLAMIGWILTGYYMWWGIPGHRRWGTVAIIAGVGAFVVFTLRL